MFVDLAESNSDAVAMWWFALASESRDYWLAAAKTENPRVAWEHYRRVVKEHRRLTHVFRELDAAARGR
jgi:hypothetical protein